MYKKINSQKFIQNITDQMIEAQIKLGYAKETLRFYYPVPSLNAILGIQAKNAAEMLEILEESGDFSESVLGTLHFLRHGERIEVSVSPEGAEYVHKHAEKPAFLCELIELFRNPHSCSIDRIRAVFEKYDPLYVCQKMPEGTDFDYVFYFKDGRVDAYYYCIKQEMEHMIYHRFTREDYQLLF